MKEAQEKRRQSSAYVNKEALITEIGSLQKRLEDTEKLQDRSENRRKYESYDSSSSYEECFFTKNHKKQRKCGCCSCCKCACHKVNIESLKDRFRSLQDNVEELQHQLYRKY